MPLSYGLNVPNQNSIRRVMSQRAGVVNPRNSLVQRSLQSPVLNRSIGGATGLLQGGQQSVKPPVSETTLIVKGLIERLRKLSNA